MKYQDILRKEAFAAAMKKVCKPEEPPYWKNFNSKPWYDKLDQDEQAIQDFLGDR